LVFAFYEIPDEGLS